MDFLGEGRRPKARKPKARKPKVRKARWDGGVSSGGVMAFGEGAQDFLGVGVRQKKPLMTKAQSTAIMGQLMPTKRITKRGKARAPNRWITFLNKNKPKRMEGETWIEFVQRMKPLYPHHK